MVKKVLEVCQMLIRKYEIKYGFNLKIMTILDWDEGSFSRL